MKIGSHIEKGEKDKCGSMRMVCSCGTHFNTNPKNLKGTFKWVKKHNNCIGA